MRKIIIGFITIVTFVALMNFILDNPLMLIIVALMVASYFLGSELEKPIMKWYKNIKLEYKRGKGDKHDIKK